MPAEDAAPEAAPAAPHVIHSDPNATLRLRSQVGKLERTVRDQRKMILVLAAISLTMILLMCAAIIAIAWRSCPDGCREEYVPVPTPASTATPTPEPTETPVPVESPNRTPEHTGGFTPSPEPTDTPSPEPTETPSPPPPTTKPPTPMPPTTPVGPTPTPHLTTPEPTSHLTTPEPSKKPTP